jgi:hypothetical protein
VHSSALRSTRETWTRASRQTSSIGRFTNGVPLQFNWSQGCDFIGFYVYAPDASNPDMCVRHGPAHGPRARCNRGFRASSYFVCIGRSAAVLQGTCSVYTPTLLLLPQTLHYDETPSFLATLLGTVAVAIGPQIPIAHRPVTVPSEYQHCDLSDFFNRCYSGNPTGPPRPIRCPQNQGRVLSDRTV